MISNIFLPTRNFKPIKNEMRFVMGSLIAENLLYEAIGNSNETTNDNLKPKKRKRKYLNCFLLRAKGDLFQLNL